MLDRIDDRVDHATKFLRRQHLHDAPEQQRVDLGIHGGARPEIHDHAGGMLARRDRIGLETRLIERHEFVIAGLDGLQQGIVDVLGDGEALAFVILGLLDWPGLARAVRSKFLAEIAVADLPPSVKVGLVPAAAPLGDFTNTTGAVTALVDGAPQEDVLERAGDQRERLAAIDEPPPLCEILDRVLEVDAIGELGLGA